MERDIWKRVTAALEKLPRTRRRNAVYSEPAVLAVVLWAVLHDRPIAWACRRGNWPMQAWRRDLPDQSTVSRRMRTFGFKRALVRLMHILQPIITPAEVAMLDGKAIMLGEFTTDPHARKGHGTGRMGIGYKLHLLKDTHGRVLAWRVATLNVAERTVALRLVRSAHRRGTLAPRAVIIADAGYDSNKLHRLARELNLRMVMPRRRPGTGLGWRKHERGRLVSIRITEHRPVLWARLREIRSGIERFFGSLSWRGLYAPPPWVRRRHRMTTWVTCKLLITAAAHALKRDRERTIAA